VHNILINKYITNALEVLIKTISIIKKNLAELTIEKNEKTPNL